MQTVTDGTAGLSQALSDRLPELELRPDGGVRVGERWITADSPRLLRAELGGALYAAWHAGVVARDRRMPRRDAEAEARLAAAVPHAGTPAPAVVRSHGTDAADGHVVVEFGRVRVRVPADAVLTDGDTVPPPGTEVTVLIPAVRPALSPGFLLVHGPRGGLANRGEVLRLYAHVADPEHAPALWGTVLRVLADAGVRYQAKVLSRPWSYPRQDAIVVYLEAADGPVATRVAERLKGMPGLGHGTSCFAHRLAPGLAVAYDPRDPQEPAGRQSFGQHRANAVADGVVRHAADPGGTDLTDAIRQALLKVAADPAGPARNLGSPELPSPCAGEEDR